MSKYRAYEQALSKELTHIVLESEVAQVAVLTKGFNWYSFIVDGRQVLVPTAPGSGGGFGAPVLFPTPNRVRDCTYTFRGKTYRQTKNGKDVFIHGLVGDEVFECTLGSDEDSAWATGKVAIAPGDGMYEGYPFACTLTITYRLTGASLTLEYEVENEGEGDMPYGFAIHPYFNKFADPMGVRIKVPAASRFEAKDLLPTGNMLPNSGETYGIADFRYVGDVDLDDVYHGLGAGKDAVIEYVNWGYRVTLSTSDEFENMVVFTPPQNIGFCLENQTCSTDAINLHERGVKESGLLILGPGERRGGFIKIAASEI